MDHFTSLIDILTERVRENPERVIYRFTDYENDRWTQRQVTLQELFDKSLEMAYMLKKKGLRPGDRAIIFSMQDFGTIYSVLGCMMAGVTFSIIPPPLDEGKIERFIAVLKSCHPKALISNYALEQESGVSLTGRLMKEALSSVLSLRRIYSDQLIPYKRRDVITTVRPDQLAYLQYTSGSTNAPKGVQVTWKALMKNVEQCINCYDFNHGRLASWVPFFHNLGLVVTICMPIQATDGSVYFLPTLRFLSNPKLWIRMMSELHLDLTVGPGSAFEACTRIFTPEEAAKYPLTHVTHFMNGSEFISAKTVEKFTSMFQCQPNAMAPGYGLAEAVCLATFASQDYRTLDLDYEAYQNNKVVFATPESTQVKQIVSVGAPVKDLTVVVGNPRTKKVYPDLRIGEIFLSGDSVAAGYWGNLRETANFHTKLEGYQTNFYKTGDLGFLYEGHLYITGRIKEMLIVNGHNIFPNDLQHLIQQKIPAMANATTGFFSCTGETKEQLVAMIESNPEEDFPKRVRQINSAVSERFGFSFYDIVFVPRLSIPRTDNSKLQMLKARTLYETSKIQLLYSSRLAQMEKQPLTDEPSHERVEMLFDRADDIFLQVKSAFESVLNIEHYSIHDSFLELGGDSLMGFELVNAMEQKFHVKLDLREILQDASVAGITNYLHRVLDGVKGPGRVLHLEKECVLDESIAPQGEYEKLPKDCNTVFLTGGTGFLGAHLIRSMIEQFNSDQLTIYCLVRADSEASGLTRIVENMKHYHCWKDRYLSFLRPVIGDLSSPKLGIADELWEQLANEVEMVYHNGAILNFVFPYQFLKTTNVHGTIETLRLACDGKPKYYHYVSSYSVYDTPGNKGRHLMEDDPLRSWKGFSLSYSETKWVSEKLVGIARKRGLRAAIYRPGDITGAASGIWDVDDMVSRMIVSMIQLKAIPFASYQFHMTPVDYVANALVYISRKRESGGHAFNLINPEPVSLKNLVAYIRNSGYPIRYIPFSLWKRRIRNMDASNNAMVLLECLFENGTDTNPNVLRHFVGKEATYDMRNTELLLNQSGISCPPVRQKYISAYLKYFEKTGHLNV